MSSWKKLFKWSWVEMLSSKENYNIANNCAVLEQMFIVKSSVKSVKSIWPPPDIFRGLCFVGSSSFIFFQQNLKWNKQSEQSNWSQILLITSQALTLGFFEMLAHSSMPICYSAATLGGFHGFWVPCKVYDSKKRNRRDVQALCGFWFALLGPP